MKIPKIKTRFLLPVLNGVFGDHLEKKKSRFAIKMRLHNAHGPLLLTEKNLAKHKLGKKVCVLVHGSCSSEQDWNFEGEMAKNYGSLLQEDKGYAPLFLRYNSGLHISTNGRRLAQLMESFLENYPGKLSEIIFIGHSMGGLLLRSACHYGRAENQKWTKLVSKIFYLGTPHLGTHFEKLGKLTTTVLNVIPNPVTKIIATLGDLRSDGIKDLRHGYLTEDDWQGQKANNLFYYHKNKTPLLEKSNHYLICGTLSKVANSKLGRLFGDGMVHPASATGQGLFQANRIPFLEEHRKIIPGISHYNLQRSPRVYEQIKEWC